MTRQHKTPRQRAEEALAVEERRVSKLTKKRTQLTGELEVLETDLRAALARRDHLKKHPDLPQNPTTNTTEENTHP